jgi:hypothetical protein
MKLTQFSDQVGDFVYGKLNTLTEVTFAMPFNDYNELVIDCLNSCNFIQTPGNTVGVIKHFNIHGVRVTIVDGEIAGLGEGGPTGNQKFFETFSFEPLAHQQKKTSVIQMQTLPHRA